MKTFLVYGAIRFWHDCVMEVTAIDEQEAREKAKKLECEWLDTDPPDSSKEFELDISDVELQTNGGSDD